MSAGATSIAPAKTEVLQNLRLVAQVKVQRRWGLYVYDAIAMAKTRLNMVILSYKTIHEIKSASWRNIMTSKGVNPIHIIPSSRYSQRTCTLPSPSTSVRLACPPTPFAHLLAIIERLTPELENATLGWM